MGGDEITLEEAPDRLLSCGPISELGGGLQPSVRPMGGLSFPDPCSDLLF